MVGEECFILNNVNLAAIMAKKWPVDFNNLRATLPPWMVILVLGGGKRLPEGRIEYEEDALREVAKELSIRDLPTSLPGVPGAEKGIAEMLRNPWPKERTYWKFASKGACQDLFFHTVMNKASTFLADVTEVAAKYDYPAREMGCYVQPVIYGGACHFECNFYYDPNNADEVNRIKNLYAEAAEVTMDKGGFYSRPYGVVADMVYSRSASYTARLKQIKQLMDPNNVMSPGRLCF
jgi:hypothetical protein